MDEIRAMHRSAAELEAGLAEILRAPRDVGAVRLVVRRPARDERESLAVGELDCTFGLVGDSWRARELTKRVEPRVDTQLTLINARLIALVAGDEARWPLAGDQLYVDLDLSWVNLPPGTRLAVGDAVVEITAEPHTGCKKFVARFGLDAMLFVNSETGLRENLRGIHATVVQAGAVRVGDRVVKLAPTPGREEARAC